MASVTASERQTTSLIVIGIILLPLQIWPAMPLPEMQLSDIVFAIAFAQFLIARREIPPAAISIPIAAFAGGAAISTLAEIEKMARRLDLLSLTERTCKWPIGDPTEESFHFCGLPSTPGKPYCEHHVAVAFQPMSTRRDRARAGR